jgi:transposase-like protein
MDPWSWLRKQLETADVDLLREMARSFAETLMSAEADAMCGAGYGERSEKRWEIHSPVGAKGLLPVSNPSSPW